MNVPCELEIPGRMYHVAPGAAPPENAQAWLVGDKLFIHGKEVGTGVIKRVDAEPIYAYSQTRPKEWLVHSTTVDCILHFAP